MQIQNCCKYKTLQIKNAANTKFLQIKIAANLKCCKFKVLQIKHATNTQTLQIQKHCKYKMLQIKNAASGPDDSGNCENGFRCTIKRDEPDWIQLGHVRCCQGSAIHQWCWKMC